MRYQARFALCAAVAAALTLGACQKKGSVEARNESAESVATKLAASNLRPRPGRWESTMKMESIDMPGMTPQMREAMTKSVGTGMGFATCLTPEMASRPPAEMFQQKRLNCTYDHFSMAGGKIDAAMACKPGNGEMTMAMAGTYGPDQYAVRVTTHAAMPGGRAYSTVGTMTSRRVGECNGTEANGTTQQ